MLQETRKFYKTTWCKEVLQSCDLLCFNGIRDLTDIVVSYCDIDCKPITIPLGWLMPHMLCIVKTEDESRTNFSNHVREIYYLHENEIIYRDKSGTIIIIMFAPNLIIGSGGNYLSEVIPSVIQMYSAYIATYLDILDIFPSSCTWKCQFLDHRIHVSYDDTIITKPIQHFAGFPLCKLMINEELYNKYYKLHKRNLYLPHKQIPSREAWF